MRLFKLIDMYKRAAAGVISFDFDDTLYASGDHLLNKESGEEQEGDYDDLLITRIEFEKPGWKTTYVELMRQYIKGGNTVVVVTSRLPGEAERAKQMLSEIGIDVDVYSAFATNDSNKSEILMQIGAVRHYDDWVEDPGLQEAKDAGIEIIRADSGPPDV